VTLANVCNTSDPDQEHVKRGELSKRIDKTFVCLLQSESNESGMGDIIYTAGDVGVCGGVIMIGINSTQFHFGILVRKITTNRI